MANARLYLASASPRRRALITRLRLPFEVGVPPVDEPALEAGYVGPVEGLSEYLARHKALAAARALVSDSNAPSIVIGADTTVILNGSILGKPRDLSEAQSMLRRLRGRQHTVATGMALVAVPGELGASAPMRAIAKTVTTRVTMRDYTETELASYLATGDSLDKAGGYAVQHQGFQPVAGVEGCFLGVIGLPLCAATALLAEFGTRVEPDRNTSPVPDKSPCAWCDRCQAPLPDFVALQRE